MRGIVKFIATLFIFIITQLSCKTHSGVVTIVNGFSFHNDGGNRKILTDMAQNHRLNIYENVVSYDNDERFIIVRQIIDREQYRTSLAFFLYQSYLHYSEDLKSESQENMTFTDSLNHALFTEYGASFNNTSEDIDISLRIADSLLDNHPYYSNIIINKVNYWIIDVVNMKLHGPLNKKDFLNKRKLLNIQDALRV